MTPPTTSPVTVHKLPLRARHLVVKSVTDVAARMRRIRFASDELADFVTLAPDDHVKLVFTRDAEGRPVRPTVENDRWVGGRDLVTRDYTVRWADPAAGLLDIDFVLHDHGVAGQWASTAKPGDDLCIIGPRGSVTIAPVFSHYMLACDETALPAAARWLEEMPLTVSAHVFAEVTDAGDELELASQARATVTWLHRGEAAPGASLAVRALMDAPVPDGLTFWWVAGESLSIKPARTYFKQELGLDRDHYDVDGYWRRGVVDHDHHTEEE